VGAGAGAGTFNSLRKSVNYFLNFLKDARKSIGKKWVHVNFDITIYNN